jgi:SAM-dependent methyltransferase
MSLPTQYFDRLYAADPDPWGFRTRWYEQRKYALTLAALPRARYRSGFEPGCSIGVLSALLAERCDLLLAIDPVAAAVSEARTTLAGRAGVRVEQAGVPEDWPAGEFDLIVLSELGYYLDQPTLAETLTRALAALLPDGDLVAVHWRPPVPDYPLTGDDVHRALREVPELTRVVVHEEDDFLLEVFRKGPGVSVATAAGLR